MIGLLAMDEETIQRLKMYAKNIWLFPSSGVKASVAYWRSLEDGEKKS